MYQTMSLYEIYVENRCTYGYYHDYTILTDWEQYAINLKRLQMGLPFRYMHDMYICSVRNAPTKKCNETMYVYQYVVGS